MDDDPVEYEHSYRIMVVTFRLEGEDAYWTEDVFRQFLEQELWNKDPKLQATDPLLEPTTVILSVEDQTPE